MKKYGNKSQAALDALRQVNFSEMLYRGYWVKRSAFSGDMWIERDGFCIARLKPTESWDAGRKVIDSLLG